LFPYGWLIACSRSQISLNFLQVADSNEITRNLYDLTFDTYKDKVVQVAFRSVPMSKVKLDLRSIIGCGPADILDFLPAIDYIGFDANPKYIQEARKRYKDRGTFLCELVWLNLWLGLYNRIHFFAFREAETLIGLTYKFCLSPNTQENHLFLKLAYL
jgi:hypothetical protein